MREFRDTENRTWKVSVNVGTIKAVREVLNVDLNAVTQGEAAGKNTLTALITDPIQVANILYVICRRQAETIGVTDEDFGYAMGGKSLADGRAALLEELVNFTPDPREQKVVTQQIMKLQELKNKAYERTLARINSPELKALMNEQLDNLYKETDLINDEKQSESDSTFTPNAGE